MKKIRLFVSDVDRNHVQRISQCVAHHGRIEMVGSCGDGNEALRCVAALRPDALITDIQLPGLDGIRLLKDLSGLRNPPAVIVCTRFYSDICITEASHYAARYFLYKPLDYNRIPEVILECCRGSANFASGRRDDPCRDRSRAIRVLLREMGIPARLTGCTYLTDSLITLTDNSTLLRNLTKGLYAEVAEHMDTSAANVERSVRSAIHYGFTRGSMREAFRDCPSNKAFIEYLAARLEEAEPSAETVSDMFL